MKTVLKTILITLVFCLSSCKPSSFTPSERATTEVDTVNTSMPGTNPSQPILKTTMGDFVIVSVRFVEEVNGAKPQIGEKILLVFLTQPGSVKLDPAKFSLEEFDNMIHNSDIEIYILGNDGSHTISTMGGWVDDEFAMGFRVPLEAKMFTLYWSGNSPIDLNIEK